VRASFISAWLAVLNVCSSIFHSIARPNKNNNSSCQHHQTYTHTHIRAHEPRCVCVWLACVSVRVRVRVSLYLLVRFGCLSLLRNRSKLENAFLGISYRSFGPTELGRTYKYIYCKYILWQYRRQFPLFPVRGKYAFPPMNLSMAFANIIWRTATIFFCNLCKQQAFRGIPVATKC